ncbi:MAG: carbohydrate ABC transporter permease [Anaerolineales bacterium]|nr:carbohydrate ABC transporter permease [Anaerolineales bacterium]
MANFYETGPAKPVTESVRVDKVTPGARARHNIRAAAVILFAIIGLIPIFIMVVTAFKTRADVVAVPPKVLFQPTLEGFVFLLTERVVLPPAALAEKKQSLEQLDWMERVAMASGQTITGPSDYVRRLWNSVIIAGISTLISVFLGLLAAYAFSRFPIAGKDDLLFFILSTRMLPAVVVTIPLFLMYRQFGLHDTHLGMILLYTAFNLSLAVWLLKGFIDEIPKEYEEAALVDGYSRMQAFRKIVIPQAATGIAATTVFSVIFAWNEYAFALMLTSEEARTAPPSIATMLGRGGIEWSAIAAGSLGFLIPVVIVTFILRKYLLRGVTFGAIRQ